MEKINEVFVIPTGASYAAEVDGVKLYSSDSLKKKYIQAINESSFSKDLAGIENLVENNVILPCFSSSGLFDFFKRKFLRNFFSISDMGDEFYGVYLNKRIYILINNNANIFTHVSNDKLAKLTIHEMIHFFASVNNEKYISLFLPELVKFYKKVFFKFFSADIPVSQVQEIVVELNNKFEKGSFYLKDAITFFVEKLSPYSTQNLKSLTQTSKTYVYAFYYSITANKLIYESPYIQIPMVFSSVYKSEFNVRVPGQLYGQEATATSEVISTIASEGVTDGKTQIVTKYLINWSDK
jgi:hypothetical protein